MELTSMKTPTTVREAAQIMAESFSEDEKTQVIASEATSVPLVIEGKEITMPAHTNINYHFGAGMAIRNNWNLWKKESSVVQDAIKNYKLAHADDISGMIFEWAFAITRGEDFDAQEFSRQTDSFWMQTTGKSAIEAAN